MFIYVMDKKSRKFLEKNGYVFIKDNAPKGKKATIRVFQSKSEQCYENLAIPCIVSDTLTF